MMNINKTFRGLAKPGQTTVQTLVRRVQSSSPVTAEIVSVVNEGPTTVENVEAQVKATNPTHYQVFASGNLKMGAHRSYLARIVVRIMP
jgi:hypothetical protein